MKLKGKGGVDAVLNPQKMWKLSTIRVMSMAVALKVLGVLRVHQTKEVVKMHEWKSIPIEV